MSEAIAEYTLKQILTSELNANIHGFKSSREDNFSSFCIAYVPLDWYQKSIPAQPTSSEHKVLQHH